MRKLVLSAIITTSTLFGWGGFHSHQTNCNSGFVNILNNYPKQTLSTFEKSALEHMAEEEKLARDVYITLYNKWGLRVFNNISKAEQHHMDMVDLLLRRYGMRINNLPVGEFHNSNVQALYNKLVAQGSKNRVEALKVGALIEDLDIYDLERYMSESDNKDMLFVFKNLTKGSRNHMRAFVRFLNIYGASYSPKYISLSQFNSIINSNIERGIIR